MIIVKQMTAILIYQVKLQYLKCSALKYFNLIIIVINVIIIIFCFYEGHGLKQTYNT